MFPPKKKEVLLISSRRPLQERFLVIRATFPEVPKGSTLERATASSPTKTSYWGSPSSFARLVPSKALYIACLKSIKRMVRCWLIRAAFVVKRRHTTVALLVPILSTHTRNSSPTFVEISVRKGVPICSIGSVRFQPRDGVGREPSKKPPHPVVGRRHCHAQPRGRERLPRERMSKGHQP